ncbi:MAG: hypothetical protein EBR82_48395 [Caulobacteraceae bacterium]|nr:hypothetical protein [Caulobacteraceae bacterium]
MPVNEYDFDQQLMMSFGHAASVDVRDVLLSAIPGALDAREASRANDRLGVDWWVEMTNARHLAVDAKVREEDWLVGHPSEDDLALETWSVVEKQVVGWTRDENKRCDYVIWLWKQTGRYCLVPFPMLCGVFSENWKMWSGVYKVSRQKTRRSDGSEYHSECVFVPRREVWARIYATYGGGAKLQKAGV